MSARDEQYNNHPLWSHLDRIDGLLEETESQLSDLGVEAVEEHGRIRAVARYTRFLLDRSDPNLVVLEQLSNIQNYVQSVAADLDTFRGSAQVDHLINAAANCDHLLTQAAGLPAAVSAEDVGEIREDVASFRKSATAHLRGLESEAQRVREAVASNEQRAEELAKEIQDQKGRLDQAIAQFQTLSQDAIGSQQSQFSEAQERRVTDFQQELKERVEEWEQTSSRFGGEVEELIASSRRAFEKTSADLAARAEEYLSQMSDRLQEARRIVNVVGNVGMTGDYQSNAEDQRAAANRWRWTAVGLFLAAAGAVALLLGFFAPDELGVAGTIRRAVVAVVLAAPAYYAAQQSREHRGFERRYRSMELELASMNPYLELLPEELQQAVKTELASRYFGGLDGEAPPLDIDPRLDLIRRLRRPGEAAPEE